MRNIEPVLEGKKEAQELFREVNGLYNMLRQRDMLAGALETGLRELRSQLTDILCPHSVEELDQRVKELDEKFPEWEHWYHRCGTTVTWCDRPRSPEHPLWKYHHHAPQST